MTPLQAHDATSQRAGGSRDQRDQSRATTDDPWPDVYFTPAYGRAAAVDSDAVWVGLQRLDGAFQMPLLLSPVDGSRQDAASSYGYSGVWADPQLSDSDVRGAWRSLGQELRDRRVVSVFLRHSPLVPQAPLPFEHRRVVTDHPTVAVDLTDPAAAWAALTSQCRNKVRRAVAHGATVALRVATVQDVAPGSDFRRLYEATMDRRAARAFYYFSDDHYRALSAGLGDDLLIATGRDADGVVQTACLLLRHGPYLHYHLSGSSPDGARTGLNNLLLWRAAEHGAGLGCTTLHLGGGLSPGDDLQRFKAAFGRTLLTYRASGWILDPVAYARLERAAGPSTDPAYFPTYRRR